MSHKTTIPYLDTLRALATVCVIVIHVTSPLVNMAWGKNMPYWWIGNGVNSAVRFAVPMFLMLSGATLLTKNYNLKEYFRRRFTRVLLPFLFWLIVYAVFRWLMLKPSQQPHDLQAVLSWTGKLFLKEGISKHFWYVYMIVFIYLFVPWLGKALRAMRVQTVSVLLLLWIIACGALKSTPLNMYNWGEQYGSRLLGYCLYTGYLILGFYLSHLPHPGKKIRLGAIAAFIVTVIVAAWTAGYHSMANHKLTLTIYNYLSVNTIIQSIAVFIIFKDHCFCSTTIVRIEETISRFSYGIYLVHIMIIGILFKNAIYWNFAHPLISLPVLTLMVLLISWSIIFLLRKIPGGKYVAG